MGLRALTKVSRVIDQWKCDEAAIRKRMLNPQQQLVGEIHRHKWQ
jgi:hypothetical protein